MVISPEKKRVTRVFLRLSPGMIWEKYPRGTFWTRCPCLTLLLRKWWITRWGVTRTRFLILRFAVPVVWKLILTGIRICRHLSWMVLRCRRRKCLTLIRLGYVLSRYWKMRQQLQFMVPGQRMGLSLLRPRRRNRENCNYLITGAWILRWLISPIIIWWMRKKNWNMKFVRDCMIKKTGLIGRITRLMRIIKNWNLLSKEMMWIGWPFPWGS